MTLHQNIVLDLLPLVRSGQASAESRQAVERHLDEHPELARYAALLPTPDPALELAALRRTRKRLTRAAWQMGVAIFFTLLPLSFIVDEHGFRLMFAQFPAVMFGCWMLAAGLWVDYFLRARRPLARPRR